MCRDRVSTTMLQVLVLEDSKADLYLASFLLPLTLSLLSPARIKPRRFRARSRRRHKLNRTPPRRRPRHLPLLGHYFPRPSQLISKRPTRKRSGIPQVCRQCGGILGHRTSCSSSCTSGVPANVDKGEELVGQGGVAEGGGLFQLGVEMGSFLF